MAIFVIAFAWLMLNSLFTFAQVHTAISQTTGIGNLGTVVTPDGTTFKITGGSRSDQGSGTNLFHSFDQFSIGAGDVAKFINTTSAPHTENIVGRVTGQSPSSIFGTIDTTGYPGANLFLMNPAGIVFGPTAKLDVGGSVTFTTANYVRLAGANGSGAGIFYSDVTKTPALTSASIAAFGFLDPHPKAIALHGSTLTTHAGESIAFVGGDRGFTTANGSVSGGVVLTKGHLSTAGGNIHIASVATQGEILSGTLAPSPNIDGQSFQSLGSVQLLQQSSIDARGDGSGTIRIQGGQLVIDHSTVSSHAGAVSLDASSVQIMDSSGITTEATALSNAGHITVHAAGPISLDSSLVASAAGSGSGRAGDISLATDHGNVTLTGGSFITTQANSTGGGAGAIQLEAKQGDVRIENGSQILNFTEGGPLGSILITAKNLHMSQASILENNLSAQTAGNLVITLTGDLSMTSNSVIQTGTPANAHAAGLFITARDILIADKSALFTGTTGSGSGGAIDLSVRSLAIQHGGKISAETSGTVPTANGGSIIINATDQVVLSNDASITASTSGPGDAGNITINADSLTVASGGRIEASTSGSGNGGSITINTTGDVTVTGVSADGQVRSGLYAKTLSGGGGNGNGGSGNGSGGGNGATAKPGKAGDITVEAKNLFLTEGAQIDSSTTSGGPGGNVSIKTAENITIAGSSTRLTSDATRGDGKGGNITLVAKNITVRDRASVTAATGGKGDAGNVTLTALDQLLLESAGTITTSTSGSGKGGTIAIQAHHVMLDGPGTGITASTLPPFADMTVTIDILHPNASDLVVQLESPSGTRVALLSRVGGSGDHFTHTQFNDQATNPMTSGSAPFTGTFKPREPLGQLNKELAAGDWVLNVRDQEPGHVGSVQSWTLQIGNQTFQSTGGVKVIPDNGTALRSTITVANPTLPTVPGVGEPNGIGGDITITAGQSVTIQNDASVSASSAGSGNAGTITINAGQQLDVLNGSITTQAAKASGGNIDIKAIDLIRVANGLISSSVEGGPSTAGGNITIDPKTVILQGNTQILASAQQGSGGNIEITTPLFLKDSSSKVDASSRFGLNGTVTIQSPTSNLSGTVGQLASKTSPPQVLLQNRCVALAGGEQSTFILAGRDALPSEPGGWLSSPVAIEHWMGEGTEDHASGLLVQRHSQNGYPIMTAIQNETQTISLRRLTPPGFLVRTFATGTTGCPS